MPSLPFSHLTPVAAQRSRALLFAVVAVALIVADTRTDELGSLRQGIGNVLLPVQQLVSLPWRLSRTFQQDFTEVTRLRAENAELRRIEAVNAKALLEREQLMQENRQLRELSGARERAPVRSILAQALYETSDAYSRRLILDRGSQDNVRVGLPVIDTHGLLGQITRVYAYNSELSLVTDSDMTVPVQVRRNGMRAVVFGTVHPSRMELRYVSPGSDLRKGDVLVTSGLDTLYPPGLPVGVVMDVRATSGEFLDVPVQPVAQVRASNLAVILQVDTSGIPVLRSGATAAPSPSPSRTGRPSSP